ncbi:helix-turn-helix domain-containing protein [Cellulomonas composti]|uniref:helix-turn-helix domain-containing protein n=1 Tax=Cellulomonas composti TaxID=266130 RepID=UPI001FE6F157|nr:helix-turn-helix domain-containing protein [Cellulomonas composti]
MPTAALTAAPGALPDAVPAAVPEVALDDGPAAAAAARTERDLPNPLSGEALKAFAHPLRIAMYRYLTAHGSGTASQIARHLGESTGQTSYHLRQLERHGLIEDDPQAPTGGRERWWRPVGFSIDRRNLEDPASRLAVDTALRAVIQERAETLQVWFDTIDDEAPWDDGALHTASSSDLTLEEASALGEELQHLLDRHTEAAKARKAAGETEGRRRVRVYLDVFPLPLGDQG